MNFQLISPENNCPYTVLISNAEITGNHFHNEFELVFLLSGSMVYNLSGIQHHLSKQDFILASPFEIHSIPETSEDCRLITIRIEAAPFKKLFPVPGPFHFSWNETWNNRAEAFYQQTVSYIRNIIITATNKEASYLAHVYQDILGILILLYEHNSLLSTTSNAPNISQTQKAREIMEYLTEHYMESLTLSSLAANIHLSAPYVSKIFKDTFGVGFLEYLNHLRIQKSLYSLCNTDDYILDIAVAHGFNNAKTYSRIFLQETGITPTEYRRQHAVKISPVSVSFPTVTGENIATSTDLLHFLYGTEDAYSPANAAKTYDIIPIDQNLQKTSCKKKPKTWNQILSVGPASLLLQRRTQEDIVQCSRELGYQYIRFIGVLSDILQIYQEDENGEPKYFWILIDEILDFLKYYNLKPFICLGFMPEKLAARKSPSPYQWNANTSKPASLNKWTTYLQEFLSHCVNRYSYKEVLTWKFEFWNAPELQGIFWHDSEEDFQKFFLASYHAFRKILPDGCFGSPGFVKFSQFEYTRRFLSFCTKNKVKFDFISFHSYIDSDYKNQEENTRLIRTLSPDFIKDGAEYIAVSAKELGELLSEYGFRIPLYITEWNISPYFHDLSRDTCFMGAYIANTINHLPACVEGISFWALNDYLTEHIPQQELFTGELGMKTHTGLPKPTYLAFVLLNRMGELCVASEKDYYITMMEKSYQLLLYNHTFYSEDFLTGKSRKLSYKDRYQIFSPTKEKLFNIHLTLPPGEYRIEHHALNREHGSIYDSWIRMGAPKEIDPATHQYLATKGYPDIHIRHQKISEHLLLSEPVPVHGMLLIVITKID